MTVTAGYEGIIAGIQRKSGVDNIRMLFYPTSSHVWLPGASRNGYRLEIQAPRGYCVFAFGARYEVQFRDSKLATLRRVDTKEYDANEDDEHAYVLPAGSLCELHGHEIAFTGVVHEGKAKLALGIDARVDPETGVFSSNDLRHVKEGEIFEITGSQHYSGVFRYKLQRIVLADPAHKILGWLEIVPASE